MSQDPDKVPGSYMTQNDMQSCQNSVKEVPDSRRNCETGLVKKQKMLSSLPTTIIIGARALFIASLASWAPCESHGCCVAWEITLISGIRSTIGPAATIIRRS